MKASSAPLRFALCGAAGRMGRAIADCAERAPQEYQLAAACQRGGDLAAELAAGEVAIDFSSPDALHPLLDACLAQGKPLVVGTTGHDQAGLHAIEQAAGSIPIVLAANFSVGVNALFWLTRQAAQILGPGFDLEVIEVHHRLKKDAPSGTARRLAAILADARGLSLEHDVRHGREGQIGARSPHEIGLHAVRGGDVVGDHTVLFADTGERLELVHRASSRETFAAGALRAAAWLRGRAPGLYDMEDVLGLRNRAATPAG